MKPFIINNPPGFSFEEKDHRYTLNKIPVPGATDVIRSSGRFDLGFVDAATLARAGAWGKRVHSVTARYDSGESQVLENKLARMVDLWLIARTAVMGRDNPDTSIIEQPIFNESEYYACTPDRVWDFRFIKGYVYIIDIKTGVINKDYVGLQLGAYAGAVLNLLTHGECLPRIRIKTFTVGIKDGAAHPVIREVAWQNYFSEFKGLLNKYINGGICSIQKGRNI